MVSSPVALGFRRLHRGRGIYQPLRLSTTSATSSPFDFAPYKGDFPAVTSLQWKLLEALALKLYNWNAKVNLISRKDIDSLVPNHIVPCLSISQLRVFQQGESIIDVGSGGGLPGLPTAIVCPDAQFTLLDSNTKKMMVVQEIATSLGLRNVRVICDRAEKINEKFDFMLGRSVSAVPTFLGFSSHFIDEKSKVASKPHLPSGASIGSGLLYIKGGDFTDELQEAGVQAHHLFPVSDLIPSIVSEKNVLYIPSAEIVSFHRRKSIQEKEASMANSKTVKSAKRPPKKDGTA